MKKIVISILVVVLSSCEVISDVLPSQKLGGEPSVMGEVGNTFTLGNVGGVSDFQAEVKSLDDDVSSVTASFVVSDPSILAMFENVSDTDVKVNGNTVSVSKSYRFTTEGIQNVYPDGDFMLVRYADKVGKSYTYKKGSKTIKRSVTYKSTDDEYRWGFWDIKVIRIEETGRGIPGVKNLEFIANHKFGLVGIKVTFEDGSEKEVRFYSRNDV